MSASASPIREESSRTGRTAVGRQTLGRGQRIRDSRDFRAVLAEGKAYPGRFMVMRARRSTEATRKLGVVAGKRTFPRSVDRSRARRMLREAYRLNRERFAEETDVVLIARHLIRTACRQEVENDLLKLARKAGLLEKRGDAT